MSQVGGDWKKMGCYGNEIFTTIGVLLAELRAISAAN